MKGDRIMFCFAVSGICMATLFTQLMLVRFGYPNVYWFEVNPLFDMAFRRRMAWVQIVVNAVFCLFLYGLFRMSQSRSVKLAIFCRMLLYGLGAGYLINGLNDFMTYITLRSLPFYTSQLAVIFGGIMGAVVNFKRYRIGLKMSSNC